MSDVKSPPLEGVAFTIEGHVEPALEAAIDHKELEVVEDGNVEVELHSPPIRFLVPFFSHRSV